MTKTLVILITMAQSFMEQAPGKFIQKPSHNRQKSGLPKLQKGWGQTCHVYSGNGPRPLNFFRQII